MEKPRLSQADIIRTQIIRGFQLVQVGEKCEVSLGSAAEEIDDLFAAKGIKMIGRALSEADQLGVALSQKMRESATKLIEEKGSWAEQVIAEETAKIRGFGVGEKSTDLVLFRDHIYPPFQN